MRLIYSFLIAFAFQLIDCKKTDELLRIKFRTIRQRNLYDNFEMNHNKSINLKNETSKYVITSVDDPKLSWKLKNFLYDHKIVFNEIRMKSSNLRSVETKSNASFYNKKHMTYKELIKMIIKWKQRSVKSCDVSKVELLEIGRTFKNKPILVAKITSEGKHNVTKKHIFIETGIHAREWASVDTGLFIMNELVFNLNAYKDVLKKFVFHFLIVANPDGYIYSWTENRWWRKNLKPSKRCFGVDLNRNYEIDFEDTEYNFCAEDYKGPKAFSEEESKAERDYIEELARDGEIELFLSFHSFGQQITYPFGFSNKKVKNWKESEQILSEVVKNLKTYNSIDYQYGQTIQVIYQASGGSDDWTAYNNYSRFTFVMELRDKGEYGFFLPEHKIKEVGLDGLITLNTILNHLSPGIVKIRPPLVS